MNPSIGGKCIYLGPEKFYVKAVRGEGLETARRIEMSFEGGGAGVSLPRQESGAENLAAENREADEPTGENELVKSWRRDEINELKEAVKPAPP